MSLRALLGFSLAACTAKPMAAPKTKGFGPRPWSPSRSCDLRHRSEDGAETVTDRGDHFIRAYLGALGTLCFAMSRRLELLPHFILIVAMMPKTLRELARAARTKPENCGVGYLYRTPFRNRN